MWRWLALGTLMSLAEHGFLKLYVWLVFTEASLDSLFGLQCSDCVYYGKNESNILAGRRGAVEEILWCVIHAILEGHQSTGQAERCPLFLKCHQGLEAQFSFGPRSGFQCLRDGTVSQARTDFRWSPFHRAVTSSQGVRSWSTLTSWPFSYQLCQESIILDLKITEVIFLTPLPSSEALFLFHPSATRIASRSKSPWPRAVSLK